MTKSLRHLCPPNHGVPLATSVFSLHSLRVRLVLVVLAIEMLGATVTGIVVILKARTAVRLEIASSMQLARSVVADTIRLLKDAPAPVLLKSLDLHFQRLRHVRIVTTDVAGRAVEAQIDPRIGQVQTGQQPAAPSWFLALIAPPIVAETFPVIVHDNALGLVAVRAEPSDEAEELWTYVQAMVAAAITLNVAALFLLFPLFGRLLAPLTRLAVGLKTIEAKNYAVRLPPPSLLELATITDHFNGMARSLAAAHHAKRQLQSKLISAQDDERRRTAMELHDEVGPCLFALEANATSIVRMTEGGRDPRLHERAQDLVALVGRVQVVNRRVLDRMRPLALGRMSLAESLAIVLADFEASDTRLAIDPPSGSWRASYGRLFDLTIYRCVQESLTNAFRHARARRIDLRLEERMVEGRRCLTLCIEDDGHGIEQPVRAGLGLSGMRERVEALDGVFDLRSSAGGTMVSIALPFDDHPGDGALAHRLDMVPVS